MGWGVSIPLPGWVVVVLMVVCGVVVEAGGTVVVLAELVVVAAEVTGSGAWPDVPMQYEKPVLKLPHSEVIVGF
jgi:hypothetical protein